MKTWAKLWLLGSLYFSQGLPYGFFMQALPTFLRERGTSLEAIGLTSFLTLPWALKFLWAPMVDRYGSPRFGRRRSWILPLQALAIANLFLLTSIDPTAHLWLMCGAVVMTNLFAATQDIATDAFAVDLLDPHERGLANGVQVAGYRVGMVVGGGALLMLMSQLGWSGAFLSMGVMLTVATIPILFHTEREMPKSAYESVGWPSIAEFLRRPGMRRWLTVLAIYKVGDYLATGMTKPFLVDLGLSMADIGLMIGTVGCIAGLIGAMMGGWGAQLLGRKNALLIFGAAQTASVGLYILPALGYKSMEMLYAACIAEHLASGMATVTLFTMMMDVCRPETAATDYTVQASLVVIASGAASALSGYSAAALGYAGHFTVATVWSALALVLIAGLLPPAGKDVV